jgi:hypothetical protein
VLARRTSEGDVAARVGSSAPSMVSSGSTSTAGLLLGFSPIGAKDTRRGALLARSFRPLERAGLRR